MEQNRVKNKLVKAIENNPVMIKSANSDEWISNQKEKSLTNGLLYQIEQLSRMISIIWN